MFLQGHHWQQYQNSYLYPILLRSLVFMIIPTYNILKEWDGKLSNHPLINLSLPSFTSSPCSWHKEFHNFFNAPLGPLLKKALRDAITSYNAMCAKPVYLYKWRFHQICASDYQSQKDLDFEENPPMGALWRVWENTSKDLLQKGFHHGQSTAKLFKSNYLVMQ